tara:strand:- start:49 stop:894 length:846 start_codon:yes stop_codon:yes gene_type:complete
MIIWLASYPKSGNTLLRSILSSYFYSQEGDFNFENLYKISQFPILPQFMRLGIDVDNEEEVFKNFIKAQNLINEESKKAKFFKTHSSLCKIYGSSFTDSKNTLGAIYIVRDPRNVVTSFAHHYDLTIDQATDALIDKDRFMIRTAKSCSAFLGSWSFNYNSWKDLEKNNKYLLIKYEDLVNKKKSTLLKVFKYLQTLGVEFKFDIVKLNKSIKATEFDKMKNLEKKEVFYEGVIDPKTGKRKVFFNLGPKNDWRKILDDKNRIKIEKNFQKEMIELGYLKL